MQFIFIILGIFLLGVIIYIINSYEECFTNENKFSNAEIKTLSLAEIDKINKAYEEIKKFYYKGFGVNSVEVKTEKDKVKASIAKIANILPNSADKMNINNLYYGSTSDYGIRKYLNEIDDRQFNDIILQLKSLSPNNEARNNEINNIIKNYNDIKTLYANTPSSNPNIYSGVISKKKAIEACFNNLKAIVSNKSDKQKIDVIYVEMVPYLDSPSDPYFLPKIEDLKLIAPNSISNIRKIESKYEELKTFYNNGGGISSPEAIKLKDEINKLILEIRTFAGDKNDRDKLDIIYYGEAKDNYGLIVYLDEIDEERFKIIISQMTKIINSIADIVSTRTTVADDIFILFNELNDIYKDIYINKISNSDIKKDEIENKNRIIYSKLLLLVPVDKIHNTEIILILNTTLKRAYETGNITDINSQVSTFKELVRALIKNTSNINIDKKRVKDEVQGVIGSKMGIPVEDQVVPLKITTQGMKDDFNNIYNSFDLLNSVFKNNFNNIQKKQIESYISIINGSIDNISYYYPKNGEYRNKIISIKNVIIKPILNKELQESYRRKDEILISSVRNRFYKAMNEIKNLIINNYGKTSTDININICIDNIVEAISENKYPLRISNVNGCHKSLFDNKDIVITPKMFVSENNGIIWKAATPLDTFKKNGINNNPYLYNYELAASYDGGYNWNMIK